MLVRVRGPPSGKGLPAWSERIADAEVVRPQNAPIDARRGFDINDAFQRNRGPLRKCLRRDTDSVRQAAR